MPSPTPPPLSHPCASDLPGTCARFSPTLPLRFAPVVLRCLASPIGHAVAAALVTALGLACHLTCHLARRGAHFAAGLLPSRAPAARTAAAVAKAVPGSVPAWWSPLRYLDSTAHSSMFEDLQKGRPTEVPRCSAKGARSGEKRNRPAVSRWCGESVRSYQMSCMRGAGWAGVDRVRAPAPRVRCRSLLYICARSSYAQVEFLNGQIVRLGAAACVPTPVNAATVAAVARAPGGRGLSRLSSGALASLAFP